MSDKNLIQWLLSLNLEVAPVWPGEAVGLVAAGLPSCWTVDPLVEDPLGPLGDGAAGMGGGRVPGHAAQQAEPEGHGAPGGPHRPRPEEGGGAVLGWTIFLIGF